VVRSCALAAHRSRAPGDPVGSLEGPGGGMNHRVGKVSGPDATAPRGGIRGADVRGHDRSVTPEDRRPDLRSLSTHTQYAPGWSVPHRAEGLILARAEDHLRAIGWGGPGRRPTRVPAPRHDRVRGPIGRVLKEPRAAAPRNEPGSAASSRSPSGRFLCWHRPVTESPLQWPSVSNQNWSLVAARAVGVP